MTRPVSIRLGFVLLSGVLFSAIAFADSQARIVRLSDIEGNVQIDRNTGQGLEKAFLNLPVTQGVRLQTGTDGRAEVEFENGSTMRIAPGTVIEFPLLSLNDSGGKLSTVKVQQGTAYVDFREDKDSQFQLQFGRETASLSKAARLRIQMNDTDSVLAVFNGEVSVAGASGTVEVGKKQSVTFDLANGDRFELAKNVADAPFDAWDKDQGKYHDIYLAKSSYRGYSPYAYGASDLNYYGSFFNAPGYGMLWQPYFVGMGWDPFMDGTWAWYPGYGYMWISAYPWGWTPFHSGTWMFVPGYGWAWQPGGPWMGWNSFPPVLNPPPRFTRPTPPSGPLHNPVIVTRNPISLSSGANSKTMLIRDDSAGLGIRRGSIRDMSRVSSQVRQSGSATVHMQPAPTMRPISPPRPSSPQAGGAHSAPPRTMTPATRAPSAPAPMPSSPRSSPRK